MIGRLKGLVEAYGDDHVLIDVQGVCYQAFCSSRTLQALPRVGEATVVHIEMIVREDLIRLYGFASESEKAWFGILTGVQGVGARVALAILSVLSPSELSSAIALQDKATVGRANDVGPKLAQRIVNELKGKAPALMALGAGSAEAAEPGEVIETAPAKPKRAPKAPDVLDDYYWFCQEHVREYNLKWNFFHGTTEAEINAQQSKDKVWERETKSFSDPEARAWARLGIEDPHQVLGGNATQNPGRGTTGTRKLPLEIFRPALES